MTHCNVIVLFKSGEMKRHREGQMLRAEPEENVTSTHQTTMEKYKLLKLLKCKSNL